MRFVALPHTEGCGVSETVISARLLLGHVRSPLTVRRDRPEIGPRSAGDRPEILVVVTRRASS